MLHQTLKCSLARRPFQIGAGSHSHCYFTQNSAVKYVFPSLLKDAAATSDAYLGKAIHASILELGLQSDPYIASSLINAYVKCDLLSDAWKVFVRLPVRDITIWNAIVTGYFQHGHWQQGFSSFRDMQIAGFRPDGYSITILLRACGDCLALEYGAEIHAYVVRNLLDPDVFLGTTLINMYAKCGKEHTAYRVFERETNRNICMWNAMIGGFYQNGCWEKSLELFAHMNDQGLPTESVTASVVLAACSSSEALDLGKTVHSGAVKRGYELDPYVSTSLLSLYAKCSLIDDTVRMFDAVPRRSVGLWNSMIAAYVGYGKAEDALDVYTEMRRGGVALDSFTISNVLSACTMIGHFKIGTVAHGVSVKVAESRNIAVQSSLLTMYSNCGKIEDAKAIFNSIGERDAVVWGSMITGLCQGKKFAEALELFKEMSTRGVRQDSSVLAVILSACVRLGSITLGIQIHGRCIRTVPVLNVYIGSSLLDMYAKSRDLDSAMEVFSSIPEKNIVVFNSMICGFSHNGQLDHAISAFILIPEHGLSPDPISVVNLLAAVSAFSALKKGKMFHGYITRNAISTDVKAENSLLNMYLKCGCLTYAQYIFENMSSTDTETWNSMIGGFGSHGFCHESLSLFEKMQKSGIKPDSITFLCLISSCSHTGFVQEGLRIFRSMSVSFGITPTMDHYAGIVDLLGRAGHLDLAYDFIRTMHFEPDIRIWQSFLHASRVCKNVEMGELAADHLQKVDMSERSGHDSLLLNLYKEAGFMDKASDLRVTMRERGLRKVPGCSWIEVENNVEVFYSGDPSSSRVNEVYDVLKILKKTMKEEKD